MKFTTLALIFLIQICTLKAQPGGGTWTARPTGNTDSYLDVKIVSANEAWIVGTGGIVLKSTNLITWLQEEITSNDPAYLFRSFLDLGGQKRILVGGTNLPVNSVGGTIVNPNRSSAFLSNDAGDSWTAFNGTAITSTTRWLSDITRRGETQLWGPGYFYNPTQKVYVCRIVYSPDLGGTWIQHSNIIDKKMNKMVFLSDDIGLIAADEGTIVRTTNGGADWTQTSTMTSQELTDIVKVTETTAFAVGRTGTIVKTVNGGQSWTSVLSNTTKHLFSIDFKDDFQGYIVGEAGTLLKTMDGGTTWTSEGLPTTQDLNAVTFNDSGNLGFAVGNNGIVFSYFDNFSSVENTKEIDFTVYPNPVEKRLFVSVPIVDNYTISVVSTLGKEVVKVSNQNSIDVSNLPNGTYYVHLTSLKGTLRSRFVKL